MNKKADYAKLVLKRREFKFSSGLLNPSQIENGIYDQNDHIGPWSAWQGNLDAKIFLIGQDWGNKKYYIDNGGSDLDDNTSNRNLIELFNVLEIDIGSPNTQNQTFPLFFTNAILGIKEGDMSRNVSKSWARESTNAFLDPLLKLINPQIIITLGKVAYDEIAYLYSLPKYPLKSLIKQNPIALHDSKRLFAMYHCGRLGLANRNLILQKRDWKKIEL